MKRIVGTVGEVNNGDPGVKGWLRETRERVGTLSSDSPDSIDETKIRKDLKKAKRRSAPGPDGIHTFWWKALPSAQFALVSEVLERVVSGELSVPEAGLQGVALYLNQKG